MFDEYLEPIRGEITQSEERIISQTQEFIANAIANLPPNATQEEIRAIVQNVIENAPQAETLSEEQVDVLVNSAVDAVRADLQTGLETAETERQEIIAGQQAIRSELGRSDIEALETRLNDLPPEIRAIVSEEIEDLATISDVNAVQQSINALEQLVNNIQPGTTPEQVRQEIQVLGLVTSEEVESRLEEASIERRQIEQSTNDKLEQLREGIAVQFTDAEARRLEELTGLEARLLQNRSRKR